MPAGKKPVLMGLLAVLLLGAGGGGFYWWTEGRFLETTDNAYVQGELTPISAKVSGYIAEVLVADNQKVEEGTVLVRIDDQDFRAKVAEAEATVATAEAALSHLGARINQARAVVHQAQADITAFDAERNRAERDYARTSTLVAEGHVSRAKLDSVTADRDKTQAQTDRARAGLEAARRQVSVLEAERETLKAQIEHAQAQRHLAQIDLDNTIITAPISGTVGNRAARQGQYLRPGLQLLTLVPLERVWIDANFKETQLSHMRPGQKASIRVDAYPDAKITGRIESFSPASGARFSLLPAENASGNFVKIVQRVPVRIRLDDNQPLAGMLRPGMSTVITVDVRDAPQAPTH